MRLCKSIVLLSLILSSQTLRAASAMTADFAAFYMNDQSSRSLVDSQERSYSLTTKTSYTFTALGLCYRYEVFCFGIKYLDGSVELESSNSSDGSTSVNIENFHGPGLTLGYSGAELIVHLTWLISAEKKLTDRTSSRAGSSLETSQRFPAKAPRVIDLGYGFKLGSVRVGPLLSILHMEYTNKIADGQTQALAQKESDDFIMPHFALWLDF